VKTWIVPEFSSFLVGDPSSSSLSCGATSVTWCMVPQPFAAGRNQTYSEFWVITSSPCYPGY
jgi:hypothetical protein